MEMIDQLKKIWSRKSGKWSIFALVIASMFLIPVRSDGPYRGRVIEAKTGEPLAGVLVVGYWTYMSVNVGGGTTQCLDAQETLTDEKGDFEISGRHAALFRPLGSMNFAIYKLGFERLGPGPWESFMIDKLLIERVKWEGDRVIVPLKRVAKAELQTTRGRPPFISCGPSNRKPLKEYSKVRGKYQRTIHSEL